MRQWRESFDGRLEEVCAAVNAPAQTAIVVNALRLTIDEAEAQLASAGVETRRSPFVAEALLVRRASVSEATGDGRWWPQSESSAMAAAVLNPQPGESVLDVCSGRGNKALQIGARLAREGRLLCIERDARKAATLAQRLERADVVAGIVTGDATQALLPAEQHFDRVLLDAPCSGTGIVGRQPEARWKKQSTDGERLAMHAASASRASGSACPSVRQPRLRGLLDGPARNDGSDGVVLGARELRTRPDTGGLRVAVDRCRRRARAARDRRTRRVLHRATGASSLSRVEG